MFSIYDLLVLTQVPNVGSHRLRTLITHFGNPSSVLKASAREIVAIDGFTEKLASSIVHYIRSPKIKEAEKYAERQLSKLNHIDSRIITIWEKQYPDLLKKIYDPPPFFFLNGELNETDKYAIAVVGTRSPSDYGARIAEKFAQGLVKLGIMIISGLARGIDTIAHNATLKAGGRTIAVLGSGLDVIYPPENKILSERIAERGAVISEYELGAKPDAVNFPRRNRIISGLSLGTLIIETDINGGAMITANTALDQNREVFAVPGHVGSKVSRGCHALIREGRAKLVEDIEDIVSELVTKLKPILKKGENEELKPEPELSLFEKSIFDIITEHPSHIDSIAETTKMSTADVLVNLLSLEFKGLVKQLPGKMFVRT